MTIGEITNFETKKGGKKAEGEQYNLFYGKTDKQLKKVSNLPGEKQEIIAQIVELFKIKPSSKILPGLVELSQEDVDRLNDMQNIGLNINEKNIFSLVSTPLNDGEIKKLSEYQKEGIEATRDIIFQLISGKPVLKKNVNEVKKIDRFFNSLGNDSLDVWLKSNRDRLLKSYSFEQIKNGYLYAKFYHYILDDVFGDEKFLDAVEKGNDENSFLIEFIYNHKLDADIQISQIEEIPLFLLKFLVKYVKPLDVDVVMRLNNKFGKFNILGNKLIEQCDATINILKEYVIKYEGKVTIDLVEEWLDLVFEPGINMVKIYELIKLGLIKPVAPEKIYKFKDNKLIDYITPDIIAFLKKYEIKDGQEITLDFVLKCLNKIINNNSNVDINDFKRAVNILERYYKKDENNGEITIDFVFKWINFVYKSLWYFNMDVVEHFLELGIINSVNFDELERVGYMVILGESMGPLSENAVNLIKQYGIKIDRDGYWDIKNKSMSLEDIKSLESCFFDGDKQGFDKKFVKQLLYCGDLEPYMLKRENIAFIKRYFMSEIGGNSPEALVQNYIARCKRMEELKINIESYREGIEDKLSVLNTYFNDVCLWSEEYESKYKDIPYRDYRARKQETWRQGDLLYRTPRNSIKTKITRLNQFALSEGCIAFVKELFGDNITLCEYLDIVDLSTNKVERAKIMTDKLMELKKIGILDLVGFEGCNYNYSEMGKWVWNNYDSIDYDYGQLDSVKLQKGMHFFNEMETDKFKRKSSGFLSLYDLLKFQWVQDRKSWEKYKSEAELLDTWKSIIDSKFASKQFLSKYKYTEEEKYKYLPDCIELTNKLMELKKIGILDLIGFEGCNYDDLKMSIWVWEHRESLGNFNRLNIEILKNGMHFFEEMESNDFRWKDSKFVGLDRLIDFQYTSVKKQKGLLQLRKYIIEGNIQRNGVEQNAGEITYISPFSGKVGEKLLGIKRDLQDMEEKRSLINQGILKSESVEDVKDRVDYLHFKEEEYLSHLLQRFHSLNKDNLGISRRTMDDKKCEGYKKWRQIEETLNLLLKGQYVDLGGDKQLSAVKDMYGDFVVNHGDLVNDRIKRRLNDVRKDGYIDNIPGLISPLFDIGGLDFVINILFQRYDYNYDYIDFNLLKEYCVSASDKVKLLKYLRKIKFKSKEEIYKFFSDIEEEYGKELVYLYDGFINYGYAWSGDRKIYGNRKIYYYVEDVRNVDGCNLLYSKSFLEKFRFSDRDISEIYREGSGKLVLDGSCRDYPYDHHLMPIEEFVLGGKVNNILDFSFNLHLGNTDECEKLDFIVGGGYIKTDPVNKKILIFGINDGGIQPKFYPIIKDILKSKFTGYTIEFLSSPSKPDEYDIDLLNRKVKNKKAH